MPAKAVLTEAPSNAQNFKDLDLAGEASPSAQAASLVPLSERPLDDTASPHLGGNLRLHSRLCVWLN